MLKSRGDFSSSMIFSLFPASEIKCNYEDMLTVTACVTSCYRCVNVSVKKWSCFKVLLMWRKRYINVHHLTFTVEKQLG